MDIKKIQATYNRLVNFVNNTPHWNLSAFAGDLIIPLYQDLVYISDNVGAEDAYLGEKLKVIIPTLFLMNNAPVQALYPNCVYTISVFHMGILIEFLDMLLYHYTALNNESTIGNRIFTKIFISHQSKDYNQVLAFMELLYAIGIPRPTASRENAIFCSSYPGSYLSNDAQNLDELKKRINSAANTFYILWYTDNFFNSYPCLNEAGAIWVKSAKYLEILAPNFDESKIGGLLDKRPIRFRANDKYRLNLLKGDIERMFALSPLPFNDWELERDNFVKKINSICGLSH